MRILEQLYHGNLQPEEMGFVQGGEYEKSLQAMIAAENKLKKQLKKEELKLLREYANAQEKAADITAMEMFIKGFRMGALFERNIQSTDTELPPLF